MSYIIRFREFRLGGPSAEVFRSEVPSQDDFWSQLQQDWNKAAEENPTNLTWVKEIPHDPFNEVRRKIRPSA